MNTIERFERDIKMIKLNQQLINDEVLDVPAVAVFLKCSVDIVYKKVNQGELPPAQKGRGIANNEK